MNSNYSQRDRRIKYLLKQNSKILSIINNEIIRGNSNEKLIDECLDIVEENLKKMEKLVGQNVVHSRINYKKKHSK